MLSTSFHQAGVPLDSNPNAKDLKSGM